MDTKGMEASHESPNDPGPVRGDDDDRVRDPGPDDLRTKKKGKKKKKKKEKETAGIGSSRGVETMFRSSYRVHMDLTALADSKANIMISINGLILSIILASIAPKIDSNNWLLIPTTIMLLSCVAAIIYAILAARPRVNVRNISLEDIRNESASLLFFGNYTQFDEEVFITAMRTLADDQELVYKSMMRDLYGIGSVLSKKFELLHRAYTIFMFGITISVVAFIAVFFIQSFWPSLMG